MGNQNSLHDNPANHSPPNAATPKGRFWPIALAGAALGAIVMRWAGNWPMSLVEGALFGAVLAPLLWGFVQGLRGD